MNTVIDQLADFLEQLTQILQNESSTTKVQSAIDLTNRFAQDLRTRKHQEAVPQQMGSQVPPPQSSERPEAELARAGEAGATWERSAKAAQRIVAAKAAKDDEYRANDADD